MIFPGLAAIICVCVLSFFFFLFSKRSAWAESQSAQTNNNNNKKSLKGEKTVSITHIFPLTVNFLVEKSVLECCTRHLQVHSCSLIDHSKAGSPRSRARGALSRFSQRFSKSCQTTQKEPTKQFTFNLCANHVWMIIYP